MVAPNHSGLVGPDGKPVGVSLRQAAAVAALRRWLELSGAWQGFGGGLFLFMQGNSLQFMNVNPGGGLAPAIAREIAPLIWQALAVQAETMCDADDGIATRVTTQDGVYGITADLEAAMAEALATHDEAKIKAWFAAHGLRCDSMPGLRFAASILASAIGLAREAGQPIPPGAAELARGLLLLVGMGERPKLRAVEDPVDPEEGQP